MKLKPPTHEHNPLCKKQLFWVLSRKWMLQESRSWHHSTALGNIWSWQELLVTFSATYVSLWWWNLSSLFNLLLVHACLLATCWLSGKKQAWAIVHHGGHFNMWMDDGRQDNHSAGIGKEYTPKYERTSLMACPFLWHPIVISFFVRRVRSHIAVQSRFFLHLGSTITWAIG